MANNRMFLIHRPTKLGIMLGKRMGWGWYKPPEAAELQRFYDYHRRHSHQDDFVLAMEDSDDWICTTEWVEGLRVFECKL